MPRRKASATPGEAWIWIRKGDHRADAENLIARNVREHGGKLTGAPTVRYRRYPSGMFTSIAVDHAWWLDAMKQHPEWGNSSRDDGLLDELIDLGERDR